DAAEPNTTIVVAGGVHAEQLTISKDGLTLIGRDTQLVPPPVADPNLCSGLAGPAPGQVGVPTETGICVVGHDVTFLPFTDHFPVAQVGRPVRSVRITGFDITGFTGPHIAVLGGQGVRVDDNDLARPTSFGVLSDGSRHSRITGNRITGFAPPDVGYIGVCVHDVAAPVVDDNDIAGQLIGICVGTTGAQVADNRVHGNCVGMYVDPGVGATITRNHIFDNNECDLSGAEFGRGITMAGAIGTVVRHNLIEGHHAADGAPAVRITDDVGGWHAGTGTVATRNVVTNNTIADNTLDLVSTATGRNRIAHNVCTSSVPANLCG
ncbi:MAG: right-handed parallel beta-helix repeat-containing protein, partial [Ilumatobacteraceae bacterium]